MKFADADLVGMPVQVIVGAKGIAKGIVERKVRATGERDEIPARDAVAALAARRCGVTLKVKPPVSPMLAKLAREMPVGEQWAYEPKWDGFRCIVFRDGKEIELGSRNEKPLTRYFPDLIEPLLAALPDGAVVDGEIVIKTDDGLDFDLLSLRIHPAASRVAMLAEETPAAFVAFDLLAEGKNDLRELPFEERRAKLEAMLGDVDPQVHLTPITRDPDKAREWFDTLRGRRARRRRREGPQRHVQGRRARLAQGQAPAHRGLRRRRVPHAQGRQGRRLAAARSLQRRRQAAARRRRVELQRGARARSWSTSSRSTAPTR